MGTYILKRLLLIPVMLLGITLISFTVIILAPGTSGTAGATDIRAGKITQQQMEVMQETFHVGQPFWKRYLYWVGFLQPELSRGKRKEWLNRKLDEARKPGAPAPEGELKELLDAWEKAKNKDELLRQADRTPAAVLADWLNTQAQTFKAKGTVTAPLTKEALEQWLKLLDENPGPDVRQAKAAELAGEKLTDWQAAAQQAAAVPARFTSAAVESAMRRAGDRPPLRGMLFGDFGQSVQTPSVSVSQRLLEALPVTMLISALVIFIIYFAAIPLGIFSAVRQNTFADRALMVLLFLLYSMPSFWVGVLLIDWDLSWLPEKWRLPFSGIFPSSAENLSGFTWLWSVTKHLFLPVLASSYAGLAGLSRYMRVGMLDVLRMDYIRTARAKGCSEKRTIFKHALRNSVIPMVTLIAGLLPGLIGGSFIIETIFNIPGMGLLGYTAVLTRDYTVLMAEFTISAILVMLGILLSDILYVIVDPRISFERREQ